MKTSSTCFVILLGLLLLTLSVDAWWSRSRGSGSSGSTTSRTSRTGFRFRWNRFADKAKEKVKSATNFVKNKYNAAKDYVKDKVEYGKDYLGGAKDMWKNYNDMKDANTKGADKYFHAKGNYEAAARGPGGAKAAEHISNLREDAQLIKGILTGQSKDEMFSDYKADQAANEHGRNGGDPNKYRPNGLDPDYKK